MRVLVTGGSGTLGSEVVRKLSKRPDVEKIVVFSRSEATQVRMASDPEFSIDKIAYWIGCITNREALDKAVDSHDIDTIIHTAALKHVPICEKHPSECIATNVLGSKNVLDVARDYLVQRVVLVSTDKAAAPSNTYGLSKALMERLVQEYNSDKLNVNAVRFGNLVGSRGSVLELFIKQVRTTGVVTVTNPEMTRFFIRIKQAADAILHALVNENSGLVFVPQMKSATLQSFVEAVFAYLGERPRIKVIGARPGEKVHEEIIGEDEYMKASVVSEFLGLTLSSKIVPEGRRAIKGPITSLNAPKMDSDELLGMIREVAPAVEEALKV